MKQLNLITPTLRRKDAIIEEAYNLYTSLS